MTNLNEGAGKSSQNNCCYDRDNSRSIAFKVKVKICSSIFTIGKAHQALFKFQRLSRKSRLKCKSKQLIVWPNRAFAHQITLFVSNWQNSYNYLSVKV